MFLFSIQPKTKFIELRNPCGTKSKVIYHEKLVVWSVVGFLIWCFLDYAQRHLVDFWKMRPTNFNFIWLEWNSYNSSIQLHIVWLRASIFRLKWTLDRGCSEYYILGVLFGRQSSPKSLHEIKLTGNESPQLYTLWFQILC